VPNGSEQATKPNAEFSPFEKRGDGLQDLQGRLDVASLRQASQRLKQDVAE
jgi:hypothetical protein